MAWIDDIDVLNNAATTADFETITDYYDSPTLNDSAATTPIFVEGDACMWWPLKKGGTNGYVGTSVISGTPSLTDRILVGFVNYPFADIDAIPITALSMRISSDTTFTGNYVQWNALSQLSAPENTPISGHTPIIGYEDDGTETGTFTGDAQSVGWVASTGNDADGKQGGFDWFFLISWVGAHSATYTGTYFSGLASEYYDNEGSGLPGQTSRPIAVFSRAGDFYQSNISLQLGDGTADTTNLVVSETGKVLFFNNLHVNQELGYQFVDPASTHTISFTLTNCVHFWNDQATTSDVFVNPNNATTFKLEGCAFSRGGAVECPSYTTARWVKTSSFDDCGEIDVGDGTFENNTISNATSGAFYPVTGTLRAKDNTYTGCTDAIRLTGTGPVSITIDGDQFSGNTDDIHWAGTGVLTVNKLNGANPTTDRVSGGGSVVFVNAVSVSLTVLDLSTGLPVQNARVHLLADTGGALPVADSVTITRVTTTATVVHTAHGLVTGDKIEILGATQQEYNGVYTITVTTANAYTYTVAGTPTTPATGTIVATAVVLDGLTDVNGEISRTDFNFGSAQPIEGWSRKSSASPYYRQGVITGTITSGGFDATVQMARDE